MCNLRLEICVYLSKNKFFHTLVQTLYYVILARKFVLTCPRTNFSISYESWITTALVAARSVTTLSIYTTVVFLKRTLINIYT